MLIIYVAICTCVYIMTLLQSMHVAAATETCHVGRLTSLPSGLQQRYNQLSSPQCTNLTYIYTFLYKMLLFTPHDAEIRDLVCHFREAIANLDGIRVSYTIQSYTLFIYTLIVTG